MFYSDQLVKDRIFVSCSAEILTQVLSSRLTNALIPLLLLQMSIINLTETLNWHGLDLIGKVLVLKAVAEKI